MEKFERLRRIRALEEELSQADPKRAATLSREIARLKAEAFRSF